jgi:hypothetical protein
MGRQDAKGEGAMIVGAMKRTSTTSADLFVLIDREFRRRKPRECSGCYVPLPYRVDGDGNGSANWELVIPTTCAWGCEQLLDEIVSEFQELYDLREARDNVR